MRWESLPADTTLEAARVQWGIFRDMPPSHRLELAFQLSNTLRQWVASGVQSRHPDYSAEQIHWAVIRLTLGEVLFRQVYPDVDIQA